MKNYWNQLIFFLFLSFFSHQVYNTPLPPHNTDDNPTNINHETNIIYNTSLTSMFSTHPENHLQTSLLPPRPQQQEKQVQMEEIQEQKKEEEIELWTKKRLKTRQNLPLEDPIPSTIYFPNIHKEIQIPASSPTYESDFMKLYKISLGPSTLSSSAMNNTTKTRLGYLKLKMDKKLSKQVDLLLIKVPRFTLVKQSQYLEYRRLDKNIAPNVENEIEALRRVGQFIDSAGLEDGRTVIALKWIPGETLLQLYQQQMIKSMEDLNNLHQAVMESVQFVHHQGVGHFDLHAGNILIQSMETKRNWKNGFVPRKKMFKAEIIDYGLATMKSENVNGTEFFKEDLDKISALFDFLKEDFN